MKKNGKLIAAAAVVLVLIAVFAGIWFSTRPATGDYGLYITEVDGEAAVYEEDGAYWAFYQDGEYANQSVDQTPISDGDAFSLVYTIG